MAGFGTCPRERKPRTTNPEMTEAAAENINAIKNTGKWTKSVFEVFIIHESAAEMSSELPRVNLPRVHFGISIYS